MKFIQGIRLSEDIVKRSFDRYDASLHNQRFYDTGERVYAHSATEAWSNTPTTDHSTRRCIYIFTAFLKPMKLRWKSFAYKCSRCWI